MVDINDEVVGTIVLRAETVLSMRQTYRILPQSSEFYARQALFQDA